MVLLLLPYQCQRTHYAIAYVTPISTPYPCLETFSAVSSMVSSASTSHHICSFQSLAFIDFIPSDYP